MIDILNRDTMISFGFETLCIFHWVILSIYDHAIYSHSYSFSGVCNMFFMDKSMSIDHDIGGFETQWLER